MGFLDKPISDLSLTELQRLIRQEVGRQIPPIPAGVASLKDLDVPLIPPDTAAPGQALVYDQTVADWIASDSVNSALTVPDGSLGDSKLTAMSASKLTAGVIDASVIAMQTAGSGVRVVLDTTGLTTFDGTGQSTVRIPSDGSPSTFAGTVNAGALSVASSATINGASGLVVQPNSQISMAGGQSDPTTAPVVTASYPAGTTLNFNVDGFPVTGSRVSHFSGTHYYGTLDTTKAGFDPTYTTYAVEWLASTGAITNKIALASTAAHHAQSFIGFGAVVTPSSNVVAFYLNPNASAGSQFLLKNISIGGAWSAGSAIVSAIQPGASTFDPSNLNVICVGGDGTNPFLFSYSNTGIPHARKMAMSGGLATGSVTTTTAMTGTPVKLGSANYGDAANLGDTGGPVNIVGAAWDTTNWTLNYTWNNTSSSAVGRVFQQYNSTFVVVAKQEIFIPLSKATVGGGLLYDGTNYVAAAGGSGTSTTQLQGPSIGLTWDYTVGNNWRFGYTWNHSTGPKNSGISPNQSLDMGSGITAAPLMRQLVTITLPPLPSLANQNWIYALPAAGTKKLQSATTHVTSNTAQVMTFINYDSAGAAPTASNFGGGGTAAFIAGAGSQATASWRLDSDGLMRLPVRTVAQRSTTLGDAQVNGDLGVLEWYAGGSMSQVGGPTDEVELLRRKLFVASGTTQIIKARNFDPAFAASSAATAYATGLTRYYAVNWPGGVCTGMYYQIIVSANYTDTSNSGTAMYSTDGTTLTRVATLNTTVGIEGLGIRRRVWTAPTSTLAEGVYYVALKVTFSAQVARPEWGAIATGDTTSNGGDANNAATPNNWPMSFSETNTAVLPSTRAISALTQGTLTLGWIGLY